jgi:hypothetical protein
MNGNAAARLRNLCGIFGIPVSATEENPELALNVLSRMYLVPTIKEHAQRNRALNEIRGNLSGHFAINSEFVGRTATIAAMMQELPHWYANLNKPTAILVEMYKDLERAVWWLNAIGIGAVGGAGSAGVAEAIKTGSVKEGIKKTVGRLAGRGAVIEEIGKRAGLRIGPGKAGAVGVAVAVAGTLYYANAVATMEEIKKIIMDRYQKGEVTDDQFKKVFGSDINPVDVKKYWEM